MKRRKLLVLYTELAGYFLTCLRALPDDAIELHIVRWPVNREAPFAFDFWPGVTIYDRHAFDDWALLELARQIAPDAVLCSGWRDRGYLRVCRALHKTAICILTLDNHWQGTLRQRLACVLSRFTLTRTFAFAWVPGAPQQRYAQKLGFPEHRIRTGFYSADTGAFVPPARAGFPHRFLYVGRNVAAKGVADLWEAFRRLSDAAPHDWELWCIGTGDIAPAEHPRIRHFGFLQPAEMSRIVAETGVFVLPSRAEAWGVVLHEFAAAGFPLVCSDCVGAAAQFVEEGVNGWTFPAGDVEALERTLRRAISTSDEQLAIMGHHSAKRGRMLTPQTWAATLLGMIHSPGHP